MLCRERILRMSAVRTSFFPSIHLTLRHIALVDDCYLDALTGGGRGYAIFDDEEAGNEARTSD